MFDPPDSLHECLIPGGRMFGTLRVKQLSELGIYLHGSRASIQMQLTIFNRQRVPR